MAHTDILSDWKIGWLGVRLALLLLALAGLGFVFWLVCQPLWLSVYGWRLVGFFACFPVSLILGSWIIAWLEGRHA